METQATLNSLFDAIRTMQREVHAIKAVVVDEELTDEDLEFHWRVRKAWKEVDAGKAVSMTEEAFLKELQAWEPNG